MSADSEIEQQEVYPYLHIHALQKFRALCAQTRFRDREEKKGNALMQIFDIDQKTRICIGKATNNAQSDFLSPRYSCAKLMDIILIHLSNCVWVDSALPRELDIPLSRYMEMLGMPDKTQNHRREARKQADSDIALLSVTSLDVDKVYIPLLSVGSAYLKSALHIVLNEAFIEQVKRSFRMKLPCKLLTSENKSRLYPTWSFLWTYANTVSSKAKNGFYCLSVAKVLEGAGFPPIEHVRQKKESWTSKIKTPLEQLLRNIEGMTWRYVGAKRKELTPPELEEACKTWQGWSRLYIEFRFTLRAITRQLK